MEKIDKLADQDYFDIKKLAEHFGDFKPIAYYDVYNDSINIHIKDCSLSEKHMIDDLHIHTYINSHSNNNEIVMISIDRRIMRLLGINLLYRINIKLLLTELKKYFFTSINYFDEFDRFINKCDVYDLHVDIKSDIGLSNEIIDSIKRSYVNYDLDKIIVDFIIHYLKRHYELVDELNVEVLTLFDMFYSGYVKGKRI